MRIAALLTAVLALGAASAQAATKTVTAHSGNVSATLTYNQSTDSFGGASYSNEHIAIAQGGTTYYSAAVNSPDCDSECPIDQFDTARTPFAGPLTIADIEHDGQPDVLLDRYTGGAHCCSVLLVYSFDPGTMTYHATEHNFGDPGDALVDLANDGRFELQSADDRFAYEFTSFAFSGLPLQIWSFAGGRFTDITRQFPALIKTDAAHWWLAFTHDRHQGLGLGEIAAWTADEFLLGRRSQARSELAHESRAGYLRSGDGFSASGHGFITHLERVLRQFGYA